MSYIVPNSKELESAVIGNVVADGSLVGRIEHIIGPNDFYDEIYRNV